MYLLSLFFLPEDVSSFLLFTHNLGESEILRFRCGSLKKKKQEKKNKNKNTAATIRCVVLVPHRGELQYQISDKPHPLALPQGKHRGFYCRVFIIYPFLFCPSQTSQSTSETVGGIRSTCGKVHKTILLGKLHIIILTNKPENRKC